MPGKKGRMSVATPEFPDGPKRWCLSTNPEGGVVYRIKDRRGNHVYVGQTVRPLERRLKDAGHVFDPKLHMVEFMRIADHEERCEVERLHIKKHTPPRNDLTKGGVGRRPAPQVGVAEFATPPPLRVEPPEPEPSVTRSFGPSRLWLVSAVPRLLLSRPLDLLLPRRPRR